ncbi:MAG: GNAT family N-acetyltransferase [Bacilli bacterium]
MVSLVGTYINVRLMEEMDKVGLYESARNPHIWAYTSKKIRSQQDVDTLVDEALSGLAAGTELPFVIVRKADGVILGSTRLTHIDRFNRSVEIGWTWLNPQVWRTPVNTEVKRLLLAYAFETMAMRRVQFCVDGRNMRSQKAVLRLGATQEGVLRQHRVVADGYVRDTVVFSILREEWPVIKERLANEYKKTEHFGKVIDDFTRCDHYHTARDIISLRFKCCDRFYPCHLCHAETAGHEATLWEQSDYDVPVVCCGNCDSKFSIHQYLAADATCPVCTAEWNPACKTHSHFYWK